MPCGRVGDQIRVALSGAQRASEDAFTELYREHANAVYRFCFRATASWALAEDLTAQVFLEAWRKRATLASNEEGSLLPWLYAVATNLIRNQRRGDQRRANFVSRLREPEALTDFADEVVERLDDERHMRWLLQSLSGLSEQDQELIRLSVWEELRPADIGIILGMSAGAVRTRLTRARQRLREMMELEQAARSHDVPR